MRSDLITVIVAALGTAFTGAGTALVFYDIFRLPSARTSRQMRKTVKRALSAGKVSAIDAAAGRLSRFLSNLIRLNAGRRETLAAELAAADMRLTPEEHVAECIVKASIPAVLAIPAALIAPVFLPVVFAVIPGVYYDAVTRPRRLIGEKRDAIEYELPMLVSRIDTSLRSTRDVLSILNSYRKNAGPELKSELDITVADMQSGSAHAALSRLESRVGSPHMSEVVRGLSAVIDGNDPVGYWAALQTRLSDNRRQLLLRFAKKIPAKIAALSFCLLACVFLIYAVVIGGEVLRSIGVIFG